MLDKLKKLFTPVEALEPNQVRDFINQHKEGTYTLLDVRQPGEYERAHIPGATLIPLPQLYDSLNELDPDKPVIVY
jgi:rhodanese-related sulfurtransferase